MSACVDCGVELPDGQGSRTCSMCYGDPGHGRDGIYQRWLDEQDEAYRERQQAEAESYAELERAP